ncbi:LysR family transcriptional regulator [Lysobacter brunescens]|uniref:LysR family transcriptional regulator n=1 Tax=Lysobacter brunescens TaxID=262323 RepID=A0ABW2Y8W3_9GAMM
MRDLSIDALAAFAEFAEDGNFSRAAVRLHISEPALHTKIAKLAASVGTPLYVRRGRTIEITEAGRRVQRLARDMAASMAAFRDDMRDDATTRPVVLAAGEGAFLYLLGPGIRAHLANRRHALQLMTADGAAAVEAVRAGRAHLGIACLDAMPRDLDAEPLTRVGQVLALPRKHPLAMRRSIRLKDITDAGLIVPPAGRPHRMMLSQMLQSAQVPWHAAVEASGWELMLHLVKLGMGLAVVNACCRMPAGVVARPIPELPALQYMILSRKEGVVGAAASLKASLRSHSDGWKAAR